MISYKFIVLKYYNISLYELWIFKHMILGVNCPKIKLHNAEKRSLKTRIQTINPAY